MSKLQDSAEEFKSTKNENQKLRLAQDQFNQAKSNYDDTLMDDREKLFLGTHGVDQDVNQRVRSTTGKNKLANNVINIIFEFIESQVDPTIPQPAVVSKRRDKELLSAVVEESLKNDLLESDIYRVNDENERITPIQGFSIVEVAWDPDYTNHLYRGEIFIDNKHPKTFIPQPGVFELQKMNYFFTMASETEEYVENRYNVNVRAEGEEYPEINSIDGTSDNNSDISNKVTVITKWYKDKKGKIGKFTWVNDVVCEDYEDFFARRRKKCADCGDYDCECGKENYKDEVQEYEILEEDIVKSDGSVIPAISPVLDDDGLPVLNKDGSPKMENTKIKYFCPTRYPFVIRKNVPLNFHFGGQSDVDVIRDQQDAIKKAVTAVEEKILRGGAVITALDGHQFDLRNKLYQVVRGSMAELSAIRTMNLQADIRQDMEFIAGQYKSAQNTLGITDSYQGKNDPSAKSGLAKQISINQASGRLMSKQFNKRNAYKELFEIMFEFKLAFYDDVRPYIKKKISGQVEYGEFNKYDFVEQDAAGVWYYNTDFLFSADSGEGVPKDKMWLMAQTVQFASTGFMNKSQFWNAMHDLGYPNAIEYRNASLQEEKAQAEQAQAQSQAQAQQVQQKTQLDAAKVRIDAEKVENEAMKIRGDQQAKQQGNILEVAKMDIANTKEQNNTQERRG